MDKIKNFLKKATTLSNPKNVYGSQILLIFVLCCCGIVPFKVVARKSLKSSTWCYFIAGINHILFAYAFIVTIIENTSFIECFFKSEISKVGNKLHFFVSFVSMIIIYASCFYQKLKIKKVFDRLHHLIDNKLENLSLAVNHRDAFRYTGVALMVVSSLYFVFTFGSTSMIYRSKMKFMVHSWVSYSLPNFMVNLVIFMFVCVLKQIQMRYDGCNQVKEKL